MAETSYILHHATAHSLVLMDEIGRGTSTYDGLALAWAIAFQLVSQNRALTLFATHYFELTRLPSVRPEVANVHLAAAESHKGIVFLHEVREGPASRSYGIQVAQRAGIPAAVVRMARRELEKLETQGAQVPQMALFAPPQDEAAEAQEMDQAREHAMEAVRDALDGIDPDRLSPREALDELYRLKSLALPQ